MPPSVRNHQPTQPFSRAVRRGPVEREANGMRTGTERRLEELEAAAESRWRTQEEDLASVAEDTAGTLQAAMQAISVRDTRLAKSRAAAQTHALRVRIARPIGVQTQEPQVEGGRACARETWVELTLRYLNKPVVNVPRRRSAWRSS
jgi:hypothetical protein